MPVEPGQQIVQAGGGELPLERLHCGVVAVFECSESVPDLGQVGEVVGRDDLALDDGEVDLHLVQPGGVDGGVDKYRVRERRGESVCGLLPAVGGAVVHDPEHPLGARVGFGAHDLGDEVHERGDAGPGVGAAEYSGVVDVVGGEVGQGAAAAVGVVHAHGPGLAGCEGGVAAAAGLDGGLFVRAERPACQVRAYRPSTRAALGRKSGSVMKFQEWCCQGLSASSAGQRRTAEAEAVPVMPRAASSRASSGHDQRDTGAPVSAGSQHASALASATCGAVNDGGRPDRFRSVRP